MVKENLMVYGCYGYTGQLIVEEAINKNLRPILAGRDALKVKQMADKTGLPYRVFDLAFPDKILEAFADIKVLLHCAGPFIHTAEPMVKACIQSATHYLDITGEYQVFELMHSKNAEAQKAGIVVMPGVGFDVVPSDCLANHLKKRMPLATKLELALYQINGRLSHGTAITVAENMGNGCMIRSGGELKRTPQGDIVRTINILGKEKTGVAISWGDISTAYFSTGIPNITVYNILPASLISKMKLVETLGFIFRSKLVKSFLIQQIKRKPAGPDAEMRSKASGVIWGEAKNDSGIKVRSLLKLPEGYTLTAITAVAIAKSFLMGNVATGYKTPAMVFGSNFILEAVPGSELIDIE